MGGGASKRLLPSCLSFLSGKQKLSQKLPANIPLCLIGHKWVSCPLSCKGSCQGACIPSSVVESAREKEVSSRCYE